MSKPTGQDPNWAAQQPPSAGPQGWGAAAPPPGGPSGPGSWNGGAGWGQGGQWGGRPEAAKPGIVPLRPLNVFEILDGAVTTLRTHWRTVLGVSLAVAVVVQLVVTIGNGLWMPDTSEFDALARDPDASLGEAMRATGVFSSSAMLVQLASAMVYQLGTVLVTAVLTVVVSRAVLGRPVTLKDAWQDARPQLPRLLGLLLLVGLLVSLIVFAGFVPGLILLGAGAAPLGMSLLVLGGLAGVVVGIWIGVRLSLAAPALMLERQGVVPAMRRSAKLVGGNWWRIFGILLLTNILGFALTSVVQMPATLIATAVEGGFSGELPTNSWTFLIITGIADVLAYTVVFPVTAGITALLYLDQRIRREALDLEIARAAGVPGYGGTPDGTDGTPAANSGPTPGS
ncbi:glycerophosphoryl diester phosphodiesterase membrane domain-containing protein [Streptomyces sp. HNM0574]|uniref:glycerophosphoryl diester phosphodiesterase membrane domain-containing protein n=1 Tax=Streptomyces sp. HNM0574 TaxID=2714954 RepID=UPI001F10F18B|nr:glycerophosphoryl diester phosphodiesterase membrane domain-containing protein [Streptomyces sp. HNM0574]